jgi:hypothetical protein
MTKLLEEAIVRLNALPEDEQDRAAEVLLAFTRVRRDYTFTPDQIAGIHDAMIAADNGRFASDGRLRKIFGRSL